MQGRGPAVPSQYIVATLCLAAPPPDSCCTAPPQSSRHTARLTDPRPAPRAPAPRRRASQPRAGRPAARWEPAREAERALVRVEVLQRVAQRLARGARRVAKHPRRCAAVNIPAPAPAVSGGGRCWRARENCELFAARSTGAEPLYSGGWRGSGTRSDSPSRPRQGRRGRAAPRRA